MDITPFQLPREQLEARLRNAETKVAYFEKNYGQYVDKKGAHNLKNLFRKPTYLDWVIFFFMALGLFMAWAYITDINTIKSQACTICEQNGGYLNVTSFITNPMPSLNRDLRNLSLPLNINLKEETMEFNVS